MGNSRIPIYTPFLGKEEMNNVLKCMESTWISSQGAFIGEFEDQVQQFTRARHAIAVSNGTVAIHLAMLALDIGEGDEVITTNFTYVASSNAILHVGATPVFVDIDPGTWNIDPNLIREKIGPKTKAILYTNIYGAPADFSKLRTIAREFGLYLIEDAAESFGASYGDQMSGTLGDISTFSFFGNKTITTGEGGMVLTDDDRLALRIRKLKNQGNSENRRYFHDILGYNYRMTNIQAAIGVAQMQKKHEILSRKRKIQKRYEEGLKGLVTFQEIIEESISSYWMCAILLKSPVEKQKVESFLNEENIETRPFFIPIDQLPFYEEVDDCPVSREVSGRGLNLPSYPMLQEHDQDRIIEVIKNHIEGT